MSGHGQRDSSGLRFSLGSPFLSLVWQPEGILITPRSVAIPYGYGPPRRNFDDGSLINAPYGTEITDPEQECLNQCLINRFKNNKYLDQQTFPIATLKGLPEKKPYIEKRLIEGWRLRAQVFIGDKSQIPFICYSSFITEPLDETTFNNNFWKNYDEQVSWTNEPGVQKWGGGLKFGPLKKPARPPEDDPQTVTLEHRQFNADGTSLIYEEESDTWYCHWPEELLYDNDAYEAIYQRTNFYRSAVGRDPVIRELRGFANPARMILQEMQRKKVQFHEHPDYRQGYQELDERLQNAGLNHYRAAENLVSGLRFGRFSYEAGFKAVEAWSTSPSHYEAMVSEKWDEILKYGTSLDIFGGTAQVTTETGDPYPNTYDPPITGSAYAQVFTQRQNWLWAGTIDQLTLYGRTSVSGVDTPVSSLLNINTTGNPWQICYQGRRFYIQQVIDALETHSISTFGSTLCMKDGILQFRVIILFLEFEHSWKDAVIRSYSHPVKTWKDLNWVLEDELIVSDLDLEAPCSSVSFSPDGVRGIFSIIKFDYNFAPTLFVGEWDYSAGSEHARCARVGRVHMEVVNGVFSILEEVEAPLMSYVITGGNRATGDNESMRYHQFGSGSVNVWPAYDAEGELRYLKCDFSIDCDQINGLNADNMGEGGTSPQFIYASDLSIEFQSTKTVSLEHIRVNNFFHLSSLHYDFAEPSYFSIVLYANVVTEDIVYLKYHLTTDPFFFEYDDVTYYLVNATPELYVNEVLVKSYEKKIISGLQFMLSPDPPLAWGVDGSELGGQLRYARTLPFRNTVTIQDIGFGLTSTQYYTVAPSPSFDSIYRVNECGNPEGFKYTNGDAIVGDFPVSLGARTIIGSHCSSGVHDNTQWQAMNYDPLFNIPMGLGSTPSQSAVNVARYKDRLVVNVQLKELFNYQFYGVDDNFDAVIYANFDLEGLVGLPDLKILAPMGVI